jgi:hypothetical protein
MKQRFWLFKRGSVFYLQDSKTGKKDSLGTRDPKQAERLRAAKNEAAESPARPHRVKPTSAGDQNRGAEMVTGHGRVRPARA